MDGKQHVQRLYHSLSQLSPDVFSHPLWVYFTEANAPCPPKAVDKFLHAAEQLQDQGDLLSAGQTLLICAALQNQLGENTAALTSAEKTRKLGEHYSLPQLAWWADWGATSLCVQQGHYREAAVYMQHLQTGLNEHDRWILSNIVGMIRHDLLKRANTSPGNGSSLSPPPDSALSDALDWLLRWGEPPLTIEVSPRKTDGSPLASPHPPVPPHQPSTPERPAAKGIGMPSLAVHCLGRFRVYNNEQLVEKWSGNKCKSIFKYLLIHREQPIHREILMDLFWRDVDPEAARRSLYQAIYVLRQTLQPDKSDFPYILCEDSAYRPNPDVELWLDSETFRLHYQTGQQLERQGHLDRAVKEYEAADSLYEGDFLSEDIYEDWPLVQRENLKQAYLDLLDRLSRYYCTQEQFAMCIAYCQKILNEDNCREDAHRRLMLAYLRQGQRHLALRQYHRCVAALARELDVCPMPATVELYRQIQNNPVQVSDALQVGQMMS